MGNNRKNFKESLELPIRILTLPPAARGSFVKLPLDVKHPQNFLYMLLEKKLEFI